MRILLVGEYSRLHNSLKEGLVALGHEVVIVSSGDGFKNFSSDLSFAAKWCNSWINVPRQIIFRISGYDVAEIERGKRFEKILKNLKGFDIVQLINEKPLQISVNKEISLLKKLFLQNKKSFVLSAGADFWNVKYAIENPKKKSALQPIFQNPELKKKFKVILDYASAKHKTLHDFIEENISGIIASDLDYVAPLQANPKFKGMIPNPVNLKELEFSEGKTDGKILIFLGINRWNYETKGIAFFEKALEIIQQKYPFEVEILKTENVPYSEYINLYNRAHIVLDQAFSIDQGYNALEAMAKGKVVFTGAEKEFYDYYDLKESVNVNAVANVEDLVEKLSFLIEDPQQISETGKRARQFIEKEHDYIQSAQKYLKIWNAV